MYLPVFWSFLQQLCKMMPFMWFHIPHDLIPVWLPVWMYLYIWYKWLTNKLNYNFYQQLSIFIEGNKISLISAKCPHKIGRMCLWRFILSPHGVVFLHHLLKQHLQAHHGHEQRPNKKTNTWKYKKYLLNASRRDILDLDV